MEIDLAALYCTSLLTVARKEDKMQESAPRRGVRGESVPNEWGKEVKRDLCKCE